MNHTEVVELIRCKLSTLTALLMIMADFSIDDTLSSM